MKVVVIDYGMGNLGSVSRAIGKLGSEVAIVSNPDDLPAFNGIVLPGVGSFAEGMRRLTESGWAREIRRFALEARKPLLGICLGMQLLASRGTEGGPTSGLGLIEGSVVRLDSLGCRYRIPHVGWNSIKRSRNGLLLSEIPDETDFYFVHSFGFQPERTEHILAITEYDIRIVAAINDGIIFGTQFHPEKSSRAGMRVLRNFLSVC